MRLRVDQKIARMRILTLIWSKFENKLSNLAKQKDSLQMQELVLKIKEIKTNVKNYVLQMYLHRCI
jgi:hypothetical protein